MEPGDASDVELPFPHYRCPLCGGRDLPLAEARMTVTCAQHMPPEPALPFTIRDATGSDRAAIEEMCDRVWGETEIDWFGRTFDVLASDNIVAEADGALAGLLSLAMDGGELAIVILSVYPEYQGGGIGAALLDAAVSRAEEQRLPLVKVAATNDDLPALYFYQRHGFVVREVVPGVVADRHGEVLAGFAGIPVRDEVRLHRPACLP